MSVQIGVYVTNLLYIPMTIHPFHRIKEDYFFLRVFLARRLPVGAGRIMRGSRRKIAVRENTSPPIVPAAKANQKLSCTSPIRNGMKPNTVESTVSKTAVIFTLKAFRYNRLRSISNRPGDFCPSSIKLFEPGSTLFGLTGCVLRSRELYSLIM